MSNYSQNVRPNQSASELYFVTWLFIIGYTRSVCSRYGVVLLCLLSYHNIISDGRFYDYCTPLGLDLYSGFTLITSQCMIAKATGNSRSSPFAKFRREFPGIFMNWHFCTSQYCYTGRIAAYCVQIEQIVYRFVVIRSSRMFIFDVGVEAVVIVGTKVDEVVKLSAVDTIVDGRCLKP